MMNSPKPSAAKQTKAAGKWPKTKGVQSLIAFFNQVCLAQSSIDMARHGLAQNCICLCQYAHLFNTMLGVTQVYDREEHSHDDHSRCDRYALLSKTKGVIDVEDILAVCGSRYSYEYQDSRYVRELLINYIGLQHVNGVINFKQFITILQPRYALNQKQSMGDHHGHENDSSGSSQAQKILGILTKIKEQLSVKVERHQPHGHDYPQSKASNMRMLASYIQSIVRQHVVVEEHRQQMVSNSRNIWQYLRDRQLLSGGSISRQAIRQILHQLDTYSHGKYIRICNYVFGSEEEIRFDGIVPMECAPHQLSRADHSSQIGEGTSTTTNGDREMSTSGSYSKLRTCQLMEEIDDISSRWQIRQNNANIKQEMQTKNQGNSTKSKQSHIGNQINSNIDQQLSKILTSKANHSNKVNTRNKQTIIKGNSAQGGLPQPHQNNADHAEKQMPKKESQYLSEASLKIKQIEARAMRRYQQQKYDRIAVANQQRKIMMAQEGYLSRDPTHTHQPYLDLQLGLLLSKHNFENQPCLDQYNHELRRHRQMEGQAHMNQRVALYNQLSCIRNGNVGRIRTQF